MKIAKKVLAVVMAVAMVACLSVMAFAAGTVSLKAGEVVDGKVKVQAIAKDYADFKADDWVLTYDTAALKLAASANPAVTNPANGTGDLTQIGTDTVALAAMGGNLITAYNAEKAGEIQIGFAFKETLGSAAETILFTVEFEVTNGAKNVEVKLAKKDGTAVDSLVLLKEEVAETTTAAPVETTTAEVPSTDAPTTAAGKTDGDNKTGDTGVLAIAAGVVALAGAAFVVSKKRK